MSSKAADRIHAMQEKGILTPEQAEELLKALAGSNDAPAAPASPEPRDPPPGNSVHAGPESDNGWDDESWGKHGAAGIVGSRSSRKAFSRWTG